MKRRRRGALALTSALGPVTLDRGRTCSKRILARGLGLQIRREVGRPPLSRKPFVDGAIRHDTNRRREGAYVSVKLTVTVTIASKPIGVYFHCLTASIADCANTPFVDRKTVMSPIVPSA